MDFERSRVQSKHGRGEAFRKVIKRVRESPCYPIDIYKNPLLGLSKSTVNYDLKLGVRLEIFKRLEDGKYAFIDYEDMYGLIEEVLKELKERYLQVSLSEVANRVGMPPGTIKCVTYRLAKKHGIRIGETELKYR